MTADGAAMPRAVRPRAIGAAAASAEERFQSLFEGVPVGLVRMTPDGRITDANPALVRMFGYASRDELLARHAADLYPSAHEQTRRQRELEECGAVAGRELWLRRRDGTLICVREFARVVRDATGQVVYYEGCLEDVTARKAAEDALQAQQAGLEQQVAERTRELADANQRLEAELAERRRAEELLRLQHSLALAQAATTELQEAAEQVLAAALRIPGIDCGGVYLYDQERQDFRLMAHRGLSDKFRQRGARGGAPMSLAEFRYAGRPVYQEIGDEVAAAEPHDQERRWAHVMVPVQHEGHTVAVLMLASRTLARFPAGVRDAIESLAAGLGGVLVRIEAQSALRASEEWFRTVISASKDAMVAIDAGGRVTIFNAAAEALFGYSRATVLGQPLDRLIPEPYRALHGEYVRTYLSTGRSRGALERTMELPVVRADGAIVPAELTLSAGRRDGAPFVLAVIRDITERKQVEQELHQTRQRLELALRGARVNLWDWHVATGEVLLDADYWALIAGSPSRDCRPTYELLISQIHEDDRASLDELLRAHLMGVTPFFETECRLKTALGEWRWFLVRGQVVERDVEGQPVRAAGTMLDISDRKQVEDAARQHQEQLAHAARVATTGEMASGLAHELAQPLSAILYYAHGALARLRGGTWAAAEAAQALEKIATQAARAGEFVRHLKAFVRRAAPQREKVNVNTVVRAVLALAAAELRRRRVEVDLALAVPAPVVVASAIELEQVLLNLIRNGCDALESEPEAQRRLVIRSWCAADGTVRVGVSDNGPGVRPADVEHLFNAFFTTKSTGLGLGLSISRSLIEACDGKLWYEPRAPRGATFGFTLQGVRDTDDDGT